MDDEATRPLRISQTTPQNKSDTIMNGAGLIHLRRKRSGVTDPEYTRHSASAGILTKPPSIRLQSLSYIAALAIFLRGVTFGGGVTTLGIKKSSTFFPIFIAADSHRGLSPRPAQVSLGFSGLRYFGATGALAPRREPDFEPADPAWKRVSFDSSASKARRWSVTLAPKVSLTCSRRATSWSIDIDFKFMLLRSIHGGRLARCCTGSGTLSVVPPASELFPRRL